MGEKQKNKGESNTKVCIENSNEFVLNGFEEWQLREHFIHALIR